MKTAIFLTHRFFHLYNFKALREISDLRLVAIVSEQASHEIEMSVKQAFDAIYVSDKLPTKQFTSPINADYAETCVQTEQELFPVNTIHIICNDDVSMLLAAHLRQKFNLAGMRAKEVLPFCDKLVSKDILSKNKIKVPSYEGLDIKQLQEQPKEYFYKLKDTYSLPFILKPKNAASSTGLRKVCSIEDFIQFKNEDDIDFADYEVEKFIKGEMYHCDSIIENKKIIFSECSKYNYPMGEFLEGRNIASLPLTNDDPLRSKIILFAKSVLKALNYPEGTTHMELFVTDKEDIIFLEIAARCPGGLAVPVYKETFNVDILESDLKIKLGLPVKLESKLSRYSFWALTPLQEGKIIALNPAPIKSSHHIYWKVKEGQSCKASKSLAEVSAALFAWSTDYKALKNDYEKLGDYQPASYVRNEF